MRYCCTLLYFFFACFSHGFAKENTPREIEELIRWVPQSLEDVELFVSQTLAEIETEIKLFSISKSDDTPTQLLAKWDQIGKLIFSRCCVLYSLGLIFKEPCVEKAAKEGFFKIQHFFHSCLQKHNTREAILAQLEKAALIGTLESAHISHLEVLLEGDETPFRPLKKAIQDQPSVDPFVFFKGASQEASKRPFFTLLSWNICGLPKPLSLFFGGVVPWDMRIDRIVETLLQQDADVVCLQEVFDEATAFRLYHALKEKYVDFCFNISPCHFGFTPFSAGLNSGLFVASKYPIERCSWTPYKDVVFPIIKRGFFAFQIVNGSQTAHLVNTHMESSIDDSQPSYDAQKCRHLQLQQLIAHIHEKIAVFFPEHPILVCGDLNINWSSLEPAEKLMRKAFYDAYNHARKQCSFETCTHCDYTGYWWPEYLMNLNRQHYRPLPCILDYVLLFSGSEELCPIKHSIETRRVQMEPGNGQFPCTALSDHYPLLSRCAW